MLGFLCFRFLLRLALLYFYAGDLSASMEKILLDSVLWLKLRTISGIQSSSMDVQGVKAFRVQNRARSLYRWRRTYRSRQDRLRYAPRAKLRAQPRQETRANFSLKRNCSRRSLLDKKKKKKSLKKTEQSLDLVFCLVCPAGVEKLFPIRQREITGVQGWKVALPCCSACGWPS